MTKLQDVTDNKLVAIFDLLFNQKATFESFLVENGNNPKVARLDIISQIKGGLRNTSYDGDLNNADSIYWFVKGLNNNIPDAKHYYDPIDDEMFKNIEKLMYKKKPATDDYDVYVKKYKERKNFDQFIIKNNSNSQKDLVDRMLSKAKETPTDWLIEFDLLNEEGKNYLLPQLQEFIEFVLSEITTTSEYRIVLNVGGEWHSFPLTPEVIDYLRNDLTEGNFLFMGSNQQAPEYFYDKGSMELPDWSLVSALKFGRIVGDGNNEIGGNFFPFLINEIVPIRMRHYLKRLQMFDSLLGLDGKPRKELDDCCLVYALKQTGQYSERELNQIRLRIQNRYLTQKSINMLCEEFNIHLSLIYIDEETKGKNKRNTARASDKNGRKSYMGIKEAIPERTHKFIVFQKHYFIEEKTPFSTYYCKNWEEINNEDKFDRELKKQVGKKDCWAKGRAFMSSSDLVRLLFRKGYFRPLTYSEYSILKTIYYNEINNDLSSVNLDFKEEFCTKLIEPRPTRKQIEKIKVDPTFWYCDFEADTSGNIHVPFMCVVQNKAGNFSKEFRGENCNKKLLDFLPNQAVVYFHNLAYDIRFLASFGIVKSIIKGTKVLSTEIIYNDKKIRFKDSLPILSCKLSQLPEMFDIPNIQKEIFPYKYYTLERLKRNYGEIDKAGEEEDKKWTTEDYNLFKSNIDKIQGCRIDENHFDMWKYCSFYCSQDVNILRLGFNQFRDGFVKDFQIDPFKFISISSLANQVFNERVYYNHDLYQIGGIVRKFCSHAVYGGRCMTAYNKKWHTTKILCDFDAVSLYPSAMSRLYTVKGKPVVIQKDQLNLDFLSKQGAYIVEIEILKVNKHYAFPLIIQKTKDGNLNNDNLNENETIKMIVDNITLEDLMEFQKIDFRIIRGYYWPGERDYTIQEEIKKIFEKRVEYKKQKNPLQQLYKLIMNSCYGKTIERPVEKDYKYLKEGQELERFWKKNYNKIVDDVKINNSNRHAVRTLRPIDKHFNFSLLGIQVLSMSKRIMNEVMCLAFDLGCHIYYQDTDSFMIEKEDLPKLEKAFNEKYQRNLIGSNLGQFHCDFPSIKNHDEMPYSIEAYFLMKKMYIHKITDSTGEIDYVIRGKGLTMNSIKYLANEKFEGDYMKLYKSLYDGESQTFDLTKGQPCFKFEKNMTIKTLNEFKRKIKTNYEEGDIDNYFPK